MKLQKLCARRHKHSHTCIHAYCIWKQTRYCRHIFPLWNPVTALHVCQPTISHQLLKTLTQSGALRVISLRYLRDTLHNTNNLVPVMLCQYRWTQDRCCYYFVISTFRTSWRTSEILLPCTRMSTNDRTVGKEQQICYH